MEARRPARTRKKGVGVLAKEKRSGKWRNKGMTKKCLSLIKIEYPGGISAQDLAERLRTYGFRFHDSYVWQLIGRLTAPGGKLRTEGRGKKRMYYYRVEHGVAVSQVDSEDSRDS